MKKSVLSVMQALENKPVLLDVGATGGAPALWNKIAAYATYVGFDPDEREMRDGDFGPFARTIILNEAVTDDPDADRVHFYLTHSPQCSSTLSPDTDALSQFLFCEAFVVEGETEVRAVTLETALRKLQLPGVDWVKLDTQGTDLRLLRSLPPPVRNKILAVDLEPGLIHAYQGEDLFVETHQALTEDGFWLSRLPVHGSARVANTTREALRSLDARLTETVLCRTLRASPGWVEARYLRTTESLAARDASARDYVLLWVFALLDGQQGFALDVALAYQKRFGDDETARLMRDEPLRQIRAAHRQLRLRRTITTPLRLLKRVTRLWKN